MKKFLLICLTVLLSSMAWAYDFSADYEGHTIYYNIVDGGVEVTYEIGTTDATASYSGDELTIPSTVTCEGVTYDVIGIGENAFYKPQVTVIKIPKSVTYIGQKAFYSNSAANSKLETIEFEGDGLESIGMQAFYYAPLTSIELPSTVSSMGDQCFRNCGSLVSANIPASLKYVPANTFSACKLMESISFDGDVEEIYNNAFYNCNALKDVVIPDSVAVIGASAFQYCYALTEITIPEKVDSLGNFAFSDCTALATVISLNSTPPATGGAKVFSSIADECVLYVPEGCKEAYLAAEVWQDFGEDNILELAPLEEGSKFQKGKFYYNVVSTEDLTVEVTYGNDSYKTVTASYTGDMEEIPDAVDYMGYTYHVIGIGEYAFYNCTLTSISLPSSGSVSYIGQQAFYQNKSLVNITMAEGLETLGYRTFYNCTALESAMLPNSVSSMDENVFYGCKALIQGNIPTSLVELPTATFNNCTSMTTVVIGQENSEEEQAQIKLETIKNNAFYGCSILEDVTIPKTVTVIESSAFYECEKGLKSIEIPELVESIGGKAFKYCKVLEEVISLNETPPECGSDDVFGSIPEDCVLYVPAGCKEAYEEAYVWKEFSDIRELAPLEEGVKFQKGKFFYNVVSTEDMEVEVTYENDSYKTVTASYTGDMKEIPDTVEYRGYTYHVIGIGEYAFYNCTLTSISLPSSGSVSYIGQQAFYQNKSLVNITMAEGLETLGYRTFYNCTALESAMLPNSVSSMDENVFYGCKALIHGNIPTSLVELPTATFNNCTSMTSVVIGQENSEEEQAQIKLETIKNNAFYGCSILEDVTIPKTVTVIESSAFYECEKGLKSIEIPELVESIGGKAFKYCKVLEEVISLNTTPPECGSDDVFGSIPEDCVLYVPAGCKEAYEEAYVWKEFSDIRELAPFSCEIDPEDGASVTELSQITFSNDEGIFFNEDFDSEYAPVIVYDSEGEEVSYIDYIDTIEDADGLQISQIVNLDEAVVEAGDYTVLVAAKLFYIIADGRKTYNNEITLSYTIEPEDVIQGLPDGYLVDPENESYLESLSSFTLSLESGAALTQGSDFSIISVVDHWGQEVTTITLDDSSEYGKVICTLDEEISAEGAYFITFPKGALYDWSDDGGANPAFMLTYFVTGAPVEYSFDPEDGSTLSSLVEFIVACEDGIDCSYSYVGYITVYDENNNYITNDYGCETTYPEDDPWGDGLYCTITLNTEIVAEGTYTITIPEGYFIVGSSYDNSDEIVISYTIKTDGGTETGINGISLDSENVEGIYSVGGQKLNTTVKGVNIVRTKDGDVKKIFVK